MISLLFLCIGLIAILVCLMDWRKGLFVSVVAGFLQDPFRKMVEGEPVSLTMLVAAFVILTFVSAKMRGRKLSIVSIDAWNSGLKKPLKIFLAIVLIQSLAAFVKTGSVVISGIGVIAYLSPIPALLIAYYYCRDEKDIIRFTEFYLVMSLLMVSGIYLSYAGFDWGVLQQVGEGIIAYSSSGELKLHSGFLRAPETAAWHAGTAICLTVLLFVTTRRKNVLRAVSVGMILLFVYAIILTGRRKILVEVVLFISLYGFFLAYFRRGAMKLAAFLLSVGILFAAVGNSYIFTDKTSGFRPYFERGVSVRGEAGGRFYNMTIGSFKYVIDQNGIFGAGAGTGSQGAQHFAGGQTVGLSAEGGLGKVLAELGLPGLVLFLWLIIWLARYLWNMMTAIRGEPVLSRLTYGLISFLIANGVVFASAHQVFGDPFVLLILGWILGFVFALPKFSEHKGAKQGEGPVLSGLSARGLLAPVSFIRRVRW